MSFTPIPKPVSSWTKRGWMSPDPPTKTDVEESATSGRHTRLIDFKFEGAGWYPKHRVLVLQVAPDGWELHFYDKDPRDAFRELSLSRMQFPSW